jgi:hypothetical protein
MHHDIVKVTSPAPRAVWQQLLEADPEALVSQSPTWLDCICALGGYQDASRLYEFANGRKLVLPLARRRWLPQRLASQASPPHAWGIGGLVSAEAAQSREIAAVLRDLAGLPVLRTYIRPNPRAGAVWAAAAAAPAGVVAEPRLAHVLDLVGGFDTVWTERFSGKTRNNVRKAEKSGLVVECDTTGKLVPIFYDLFRQSVDRWAEQQNEPRLLAQWRARQRDSLAKFQGIAQMMGPACRIWVAWYRGEAAAAIVLLQGRNAHYTRGAMHKELAGPTRANDLLHKLAIEAACQAGCRFYHMGDSGTSTSLAHFKSRFGALPYAYAEYRLERLPITQVDKQMRGLVKWTIGFKDA